jgi:hypothetical protein
VYRMLREIFETKTDKKELSGGTLCSERLRNITPRRILLDS